MVNRFTMRRFSAIAIFLLCCSLLCSAQSAKSANWRSASETELRTLLPARAPVQQERIETEMRTASGITDSSGRFVAGVVLITAGYSADGKYSHYFITQVPLKIGSFQITPGSYVIGWQHMEDGLNVKFYEATSGKPVGSIEAKLNSSITRVESFRIWPPADHAVMQIGRFTFAYQIGE